MKTVCWKDRQVVHLLTNTRAPPDEGNFRNESGNARKFLVIKNYNDVAVLLFSGTMSTHQLDAVFQREILSLAWM
jgi:hypothetical protein